MEKAADRCSLVERGVKVKARGREREIDNNRHQRGRNMERRRHFEALQFSGSREWVSAWEARRDGVGERREAGRDFESRYRE